MSSVIITPVAAFSANGMRTRGGPETTVALCWMLGLSTGALRLITPRRIADMFDFLIDIPVLNYQAADSIWQFYVTYKSCSIEALKGELPAPPYFELLSLLPFYRRNLVLR